MACSSDEDCAASEEHYKYFEALCSGRPMYDWSTQPAGLARRLFPAQVIKGCSMAHTVSTLLASETTTPAQKVLVCCGASHMAYGFGVPERVFAAHPALQEQSYSIYAYAAAGGADDGVLADEKGLKAVFGDPASGAEVADVAFIYEAGKGE